jgi:hypothetical protein
MTLFETYLREDAERRMLDFTRVEEGDVYPRLSYTNASDYSEYGYPTLEIMGFDNLDIQQKIGGREGEAIRNIKIMALPEGGNMSLMDDPKTAGKIRPFLFIRVEARGVSRGIMRLSNEYDIDADTLAKYAQIDHYYIPADIILPKWMILKAEELAKGGNKGTQ